MSNIRGLIDPLGRLESTSLSLFAMPSVMGAGWLGAALGSGAMRRAQVFKSQAIEFGIADAVAFGMFWFAIDRAATAFMLGF